jgi:ankyrin repeat protein
MLFLDDGEFNDYLFYLVINNQDEELKNILSIDNIYKLDDTNSTLLHIACENNNFNVCKTIINFLYNNNLPVVKYLNMQNSCLDTALHIASYLKNYEIINLFLINHANTDIENVDKETVNDILNLKIN